VKTEDYSGSSKTASLAPKIHDMAHQRVLTGSNPWNTVFINSTVHNDVSVSGDDNIKSKSKKRYIISVGF
jgi:hypothetical protein